MIVASNTKTQFQNQTIVFNDNFPYFRQVKKEENNELDFLVDKLTNSIENVVTGDSFQTVISLVSTNDLKTITKKTVGFSIGNLNINNLKEKFIN